MVKGNIRKDVKEKLVNSFLSGDELQHLREKARADDLHEALYGYLKFAIAKMKPLDTAPAVRQILNLANSNHFPDKVQGVMAELATEKGIISIPFKMIEIGEIYDCTTVIVYMKNRMQNYEYNRISKDAQANGSERMQKFYENQMKLINGINATIERAVEVFKSEPSKVAEGDVAEVKNEVRHSARLMAQSQQLGDSTTSADTSEKMDNNNAKSDDSLVDDGIRVSGSSSDKKISRTIKVIVGSKEVITMANDKLFKNGDVNVNYIINNDLVNALDILQNDVKRLVDEYGNNNPTKIEEYNKQYRSINAKFETNLIHANVTAIDSLKALCSPKLLKIIE